MKKLLALCLALVLVFACAACAPKDNGPQEVTVFAAASLTESLTAIAEQYKADHPDVNIVFNFDSSGTLKTQIQEGAACDIFISAAQKQMNQLDASQDSEKNPDGLDFIDPETRLDLLLNDVVLVAAPGGATSVTSFADLAKGDFSLLAIGNSDVPVGQYSLEILENLDISITDLENAGKITYGTNVKEVLSQVESGSAELGIVYATDAATAPSLTVLGTAGDLCAPAIYPAAMLKGKHTQAAADFFNYLQSQEAMAVFAEAGFTTPVG